LLAKVWNGSTWADYPEGKLTATTAVTSNRNKIINGALDVWQRGTSFITDNAATVIYTADRWAARALYPGFGATQTITRESTHVPTNFVYSLKSVLSTAVPQNNGRMQFFYTMENIDSLKHAGKTITISFQAKGIGNTNIIYAESKYNTSGGRSCDGTTIASQGFTINTSSFTTCTYTFTVPNAATLTSSGTIGVLFTWSRTTGTEQVGDGVYFGAVQMEVGSTATPFEFEDYGVTLAKCKRYYWRNAIYAGGGVGGGGTIPIVSIQFPVTMRAVPTFGYISNGPTMNGLADETITGLWVGLPSRDTTADGTELLFTKTGAAWTSGQGVTVKNVVIEARAEL
jgi:hypothetical protein